MDAKNLPSWKDMPAVEGMPHGCAWGLFDKDGKKDELGTLNLLTPEVVMRAREEIKTGKSVALNWGLDRLSDVQMGRSVLQHNHVDWRDKEGFSFWSYDDEISINTQTGSQWDGLRHWGHTGTGLYYNGTKHSDVLTSGRLGVENWTKRGGIVGRGVLLDYVAYAQRKGIQYSPMSAHAITVRELDDMAREAGVEFLPGDIPIVRTGWTKWYDEHGREDRKKYVVEGYDWVGIEGCEEMMEWLWDHHFAAIASDANGVERVPFHEKYILHDYALAFWGMPLGEMWDLEELAAECERQKRWTFFLISSPLNLPGGAASPPNAIAIF